MTAHCRPLVLVAATLCLPACLHVDAPISTTESAGKPGPEPSPDAVRRTQFAELISRPGSVLLLRPVPKETPNPTPPADPLMLASKADAVPGSLAADPDPTPTPDPAWVAAARAFSNGKPERAIELLGPLDKANQELVLELMPVLARVASVNLSKDPSAAAVLAEQLNRAAGRIEPRAPLKLEAVTLCRRVDGFGRYDPRPRGEPYGPKEKANLYIEVQNLVSQPVADSRDEVYLTHASMTAEIRDASGLLVDQPIAGGRPVGVVNTEKKLFTRTPVHDFYLLYEFPVPPTPGVYTVTITIHDPVYRRVVKTNPPIEFRVTGP